MINDKISDNFGYKEEISDKIGEILKLFSIQRQNKRQSKSIGISIRFSISGYFDSIMKVTFDKNVYEFVADPGKDRILPGAEKQIFESIHQAITDKRIEPFISETILTYESVNKESRQKTLSHNNPLSITGAGGR